MNTSPAGLSAQGRSMPPKILPVLHCLYTMALTMSEEPATAYSRATGCMKSSPLPEGHAFPAFPPKSPRLLDKTNLVCGKADLEDGVEGLREEGADALEAG